MPCGQAEQARSLTADAAVDTKVPAGHVRQGVHAARFGCAEKVPLAHPAHVWFVVGEPAVSTRSPGAQLVHGVQAVAAMPSWSQEPGAQPALGASPPGQWVPASQGRHSLAAAPSRRVVPGAQGAGGSAGGGVPTAGGVLALQPDMSTSASTARRLAEGCVGA